MKILVHICCGPCAVYPIEELRRMGHKVHGLFYNPNIHPYREYVLRRDTLTAWAERIGLPLIMADDYELEKYLRQTVFRESERCRICYAMRLERAAVFARRGRFDALTTTLLYSKIQKHDLIAEIGRAAAKEVGMDFFYRDFRQGWREGIIGSQKAGMYRQNYCGCIYSEMERFHPKPLPSRKV